MSGQGSKERKKGIEGKEKEKKGIKSSALAQPRPSGGLREIGGNRESDLQNNKRREIHGGLVLYKTPECPRNWTERMELKRIKGDQVPSEREIAGRTAPRKRG